MIYTMTEKNLVKFQEGKEEEKNHEKVTIEVLDFFRESVHVEEQ